ncbi:MAG: VPLPA-CTERM sorting domain-containing protein, partial [Oceanicola sp.]|nr:VPLPA-CTERM sorting domain-containing protein [Oceanicola sp.]
NANADSGKGNTNIKALRQDGDGIHVMNKSLSEGYDGLNTYVTAKNTAIYLSGISLVMEPEDARSLDLLAPVPLPAPVGMLLAGIGGLAFLRRRQTA